MTPKKSVAWDHFIDKGNYIGQCKMCKAKLSYKSGVSNLTKHIQRKHLAVNLVAREGTEAYANCEANDSTQKDSDDDLSLYLKKNKKSSATAGAGKDSSGNNSNIHQGFTCNNCFGIILGYRYTCVQCSDYDLCGACEARGAHCMHYVLRIPTPRPFAEIQSVLNKIRSQLMYGKDKQAETDEETIKVEIKEELPDPLDTVDTAETAQIYPEPDDIPQTAPKETIKPLQILNVNSATTTETIHGNTLVIIENPVSTGSVASSSTPIAGNTKRKHDAPINVPTGIIEKLIKLEPQDAQVPNIETNTYIDVPIIGYVPVPTVSGTGTSYVSGGVPEKDAAEKDVAGESSFQVFSHSTIPQAKRRRFGKALAFSPTKTSDTSNK